MSSTPTSIKYKPTFCGRRKRVRDNLMNDNIILYHSSDCQQYYVNPPLQGALSGTNILFSNSGGKPCSRRRRL